MATWEPGVKAPADESQCCEMLVVRSHRASLVGSTREQQRNQWEREMMKDGKKLGGGEKRMRATWGDHPYYLMFQCPARHVMRDMRNTFLGCNDSFSTVCGCYDTCLCEFCWKTAALSAMLRTPTSKERARCMKFGDNQEIANQLHRESGRKEETARNLAAKRAARNYGSYGPSSPACRELDALYEAEGAGPLFE